MKTQVQVQENPIREVGVLCALITHIAACLVATALGDIPVGVVVITTAFLVWSMSVEEFNG